MHKTRDYFDIGNTVLVSGVSKPCLIMNKRYDYFLASDGDVTYQIQTSDMTMWEPRVGAKVSVSNELCGFLNTSIPCTISRIYDGHTVVVDNGNEQHQCGVHWIAPWNLRKLRQGKTN